MIEFTPSLLCSNTNIIIISVLKGKYIIESSEGAMKLIKNMIRIWRHCPLLIVKWGEVSIDNIEWSVFKRNASSCDNVNLAPLETICTAELSCDKNNYYFDSILVSSCQQSILTNHLNQNEPYNFIVAGSNVKLC